MKKCKEICWRDLNPVRKRINVRPLVYSLFYREYAFICVIVARLHEETDGEDETRTSPHSALWVAITACVALALVAVATMGWILLSTRE